MAGEKKTKPQQESCVRFFTIHIRVHFRSLSNY